MKRFSPRGERRLEGGGEAGVKEGVMGGWSGDGEVYRTWWAARGTTTLDKASRRRDTDAARRRGSDSSHNNTNYREGLERRRGRGQGQGEGGGDRQGQVRP